MEVLTLSHVSKAFGERQIIKDISFSVPEHSIFGFIGQNGAGKTTTMKMILGLMEADGGEIIVCGKKVRFGQNETNRYIGYLPDVPEFYDFMTPREYLLLCGSISGMDKRTCRERAEELLEVVGLADADKRIKGFSRGMKQRLGIAQALFNRPGLLICDEPTSALDPLGRRELLEILVRAKRDTTVIFSTHILSDVERICDKVAFLHKGEIVLQGGLDDIRSRYTGSGMEIEFRKPGELEQFLSRFPAGQKAGEVRLRYDRQTDKGMLDMMQYLVQKGWCPQRVERLEPNLEDVFVEVTGR